MYKRDYLNNETGYVFVGSDDRGDMWASLTPLGVDAIILPKLGAGS